MTTLKDRAAIIEEIKVNLKDKMQSKLDENVRWTYISPPSGTNKDELKHAISFFINNNLEEFIELCLDVLPYINEKDLESIGKVNFSLFANKFMDLFNYLEEKGFPCAREYKKPLNFWSGIEAQKKALGSEVEISDSKVTAIAAMFDVISVFHAVLNNANYGALTAAVSRIFATYARGDVNVYISPAKATETPGFSVPNNFWNAELPTLMALKDRSLIKDIKINIFDQKNDVWKQPISLFSDEANNLPIRRRHYHFLDGKEIEDRFLKVNVEMTSAEKEKFFYSKERPFITYGRLKHIAHIWRERTENNSKLLHNSKEITTQTNQQSYGYRKN